MGRSTAGVKAIDLPQGDRLVSMAWQRPDAEGAEEAAEDSEAAGTEDSQAPDAGDGETEQAEGRSED
jgi:DNA gyrase/topoisomerase IV subunit A